jgi:hypothetical protein
MNRHDARAAELCTSPTGCAFLLFAEAGDLAPEVLAEPLVAVQIAAQALSETFPFRGTHERDIPRVLAEGSRLLPFARAVLAQPAAAWWFAPLDLTTQEWIGATATEPQLVGSIDLSVPMSNWERYAQKPGDDIVTSSAIDDMSSALAALIYHSGDYHAGESPLVRYGLIASPRVRVYEIDGPIAWHQLCSRYPPNDADGRLVPSWKSVANDWDAVHLSLGGLLTSDQVVIHSEAGWSELRYWEFEQTRWLRWRFDEAERLPDITNLDDQPWALPLPAELSGSGEGSSDDFRP